MNNKSSFGRLASTFGPRRNFECDTEQTAAEHLLGRFGSGSGVVAGRRIVMLAEAHSSIWRHVAWLDRYTQGVQTFQSLTSLIAAVRDVDDVLMLISLDAFGDLGTALETLVNFRLDVPDCPIVVASRDFAGHVLSSDRRAISDTSLRLPASRAEIAICCGAAVENNRGFNTERLAGNNPRLSLVP